LTQNSQFSSYDFDSCFIGKPITRAFYSTIERRVSRENPREIAKNKIFANFENGFFRRISPKSQKHTNFILDPKSMGHKLSFKKNLKNSVGPR
jgi:hypothetical protein